MFLLRIGAAGSSFSADIKNNAVHMMHTLQPLTCSHFDPHTELKKKKNQASTLGQHPNQTSVDLSN